MTAEDLSLPPYEEKSAVGAALGIGIEFCLPNGYVLLEIMSRIAQALCGGTGDLDCVLQVPHPAFWEVGCHTDELFL